MLRVLSQQEIKQSEALKDIVAEIQNPSVAFENKTVDAYCWGMALGAGLNLTLEHIYKMRVQPANPPEGPIASLFPDLGILRDMALASLSHYCKPQWFGFFGIRKIIGDLDILPMWLKTAGLGYGVYHLYTQPDSTLFYPEVLEEHPVLTTMGVPAMVYLYHNKSALSQKIRELIDIADEVLDETRTVSLREKI